MLKTLFVVFMAITMLVFRVGQVSASESVAITVKEFSITQARLYIAILYEAKNNSSKFFDMVEIKCVVFNSAHDAIGVGNDVLEKLGPHVADYERALIGIEPHDPKEAASVECRLLSAE